MIRRMHDAGRVDAPEAAEALGQPLDLVRPGDGVLRKMGGALEVWPFSQCSSPQNCIAPNGTIPPLGLLGH
jgi:hypothetical protein